MTVGTVVTWTSQAGGIAKTKTGTIVAVVPVGAPPAAVCEENGIKGSLDAGLNNRNHESYVVRVDGHRKLYWPLVSALTVVPTPAEQPEATA